MTRPTSQDITAAVLPIGKVVAVIALAVTVVTWEERQSAAIEANATAQRVYVASFQTSIAQTIELANSALRAAAEAKSDAAANLAVVRAETNKSLREVEARLIPQDIALADIRARLVNLEAMVAEVRNYTRRATP
jgi:hypothetical protein